MVKVAEAKLHSLELTLMTKYAIIRWQITLFLCLQILITVIVKRRFFYILLFISKNLKIFVFLFDCATYSALKHNITKSLFNVIFCNFIYISVNSCLYPWVIIFSSTFCRQVYISSFCIKLTWIEMQTVKADNKLYRKLLLLLLLHLLVHLECW